MDPNASGGPLAGCRVVEFAGIGPGPMCAMLLADMGATVLRIERPGPTGLGIPRPPRFDVLNRGRPSVVLDLKHPLGLETALSLVARADASIEGYRPGTMERIGLGPVPCLERNPRLVYGRVTGWGQEGPLAPWAGHDLNYIALTGALDAIGREGAPPTPPLNLVGDYGGGALYLAFGVVCALLEVRSSGRGQVVDAAMIDGAASLMAPFFGLRAGGLQNGPRGTNMLDSGAPYYDVYECADGRYVSVAPIERKFREQLFERIGIDPAWVAEADDRSRWAELKKLLAARFRTRPRDAWCELFEGTDACVAPVLTVEEAPAHPHHRARSTFIEVDGIVQPAPAPRFSRSVPARPTAPGEPGRDARAALREWGLADERLDALARAGVFGKPSKPGEIPS